MSDSQGGFSLIELVAVLVIGSIIFVSIGSTSGQKGLALQATRDDIVTGLFYAQQIAMARQNVANPVRFVSDGVSTIDIQENGASIAGDAYPLTFPTGVSFPAVTLNYDKLGRTTATLLALTSPSGSVNITVESSGYAH